MPSKSKLNKAELAARSASLQKFPKKIKLTILSALQ